MEVQKQALLKIAAMFLLIQFALSQQERLKSRAERSALLNLRSSLGLRGKDWPIKAEPCSWVGVHCDGGLVTTITISGRRRTRAGRLNPRFAVDALVNLTSLVVFNASGFPLPGFIPEWLGESLPTLQVLDLRSASIIGPIPSSIGNLSKLNALYLSGNSLTGNIPSTLGQLSELNILDLSQNSLTGSIPPDFSSLMNLTRLELASNFLSGPIPSWLGSLSRLQFLNFSDNSLTSEIPARLSNLSRLLELDLSKNSLSGPFPSGFSTLESLKLMNIGENSLEGPLPDSLFAGFPQLRRLILSGNMLNGELPLELLSMPSLELLDVSNNNFTGPLHALRSNGTAYGAVFNLSNNFFYGYLNASLKSYGSIDLSGNYFQGEILDDSGSNAILSGNCLQMVRDQRSLESCTLFYSRAGMSFDGLLRVIASTKNNRLKFILIGLFCGLGFIVILVSMLVILFRSCNRGITNRRGNGNGNGGPVSKEDNPSHPKDSALLSGLKVSFTYDQILHCTDNFSQSNLMKHGHSGDLFRGRLEGGQPVVVKMVNSDSLKNQSYLRELEFLTKSSHARLVPLLGHCLDHEINKVLVYKYMPYGDLATLLHKATDSVNDNAQTLDWITRLKIATGAAEALSYLHHESNPPTVHRDVQASSILLDDKFEVRLGSLNELCPKEGDHHHNVLARLRQKSRTTEPGPSGSSMATRAQDVYCFGKVLLQLVTGKLEISESDNGLSEEWLARTVESISLRDKDLVMKIVDPSLIVDEDLLEELWAMAVVAKNCLNPKPSRRPIMRHVLKALENPLKVVREESFVSAKKSWSAAIFGSWRHSSSESAAASGSHGNKESSSGSKQAGRIGSHGSGGNDLSSSNKRSSEIFPEPVETRDLERQG